MTKRITVGIEIVFFLLLYLFAWSRAYGVTTNQIEFTSITAVRTNDLIHVRISMTNTVPGIQYELQRSAAGQDLLGPSGFATFFGFTPTNTTHTVEFFSPNTQPFRFYRVKNFE